ncbi:MAG: periplasmic heavy metal sensor [Desulfarculus sp.]|nr:MAG: periplasmic heavy metal sensor [Desulfarculus sp.]
MKKITVILASLALMGVLAGGAWARGGGPGWGYGPGYQGQQLSKEDYAKLAEKRATFLKETLPLRQQLAAKGIELKTLWAQPNPDQAKVQALNNEVIELRAQLAKKANDAGLPGYGGGRGFGRGMDFGPRGGGYGPGYHMGYGPGGGYGPGYHMGYGPGGGYGAGACWR